MMDTSQTATQWSEYDYWVTKENGFYQLSISDFIKNTKKLLLSNKYKKILDLGCGGGRHSIFFARNGFDVTASDVRCEDILENIAPLNLSHLKVCVLNLTALPYPNNCFDAVISMSTLHHTLPENIKLGISEVYRVLKPNGYLIFDMLSKEDPSFGKGTIIDKNTYLGSKGGEEDIPHHYMDKHDLTNLLESFSKIQISQSKYTYYGIKGDPLCVSFIYDTIAIK